MYIRSTRASLIKSIISLKSEPGDFFYFLRTKTSQLTDYETLVGNLIII